MPRLRIEYEGCSARKRARPRRSAPHCASTISDAGNVDDPIARTFPLISIAAAMGGNVRVGLEDSLYDGRQLAKSNADQVRRIRGILDGLSLEVATPTEAREMLALKGGDRVAF